MTVTSRESRLFHRGFSTSHVQLTILLLAALLCLPCCGRGPSAAAWVSVKSAAGKFTITFPVTPKESSKTIQASGHEILIHGLSIGRKKDGREYVVIWSDYPPELMAGTNADRILENIRKGYDAPDTKILADRSITISGHPARELEMNTGGVIHHIRLFMVGSRLYQIMTDTPEASRNDPDLAKFLDSFELQS